jgi:hypothetical protein
MARRIHLIEVTVDDFTDELDTWQAIGGALADAGFDDVLYGETQPLEGDGGHCQNCGREDTYVPGTGCGGCNWIDDAGSEG